MERYHRRFAVGPLHRRIREMALEAELLIKSSHACSVHGSDIVRAQEAKAEALHRAADILRRLYLEGLYDDPFVS